jgi:hypothetical protein
MASLDWSQCPAVESIPGKLSGAWVFKDTRMPVSIVFENLEAGATIDEITELVPPESQTDCNRSRICGAKSRPIPATAGCDHIDGKCASCLITVRQLRSDTP